MQPPAGEGEGGGHRVIAGRYRIGERLGRGGMADVFEGYDERLARPVAVKLLKPEMAADADMRRRFEREALSAARLSHPGVVAVYDAGEDGGAAFLVMERLPGQTLADRMRQGPVPADWLAVVAADVLGALSAAHSHGLVHRDIKPANILLDADGRAKVADFGIAKAYRDDNGMPAGDRTDQLGGDLTRTGIVLGTVAYLSPEQIEGKGATPRSDLYALSVVLYEALAGHKPFVGDNAVSQARAVIDGGAVDIAELRPDLPPGLAEVIRRGMARRPEDRYPSAAAMLADLQAADAGLEPTAADLVDGTATRVLPVVAAAGAGAAGAFAGSPGPRRERPRRRSGPVAAVVALIVLVVAAALAVLLLSADKPHSSGTGTTVPTTTSTTAPTTTTTIDPQAKALRQEAADFNSIGGSGPSALALLLDSVAAAPAADRAAKATQAAQSAYQLLQAGNVTQPEYNAALATLISAGGATAPSTTTTTTTTQPGHGKGGGGGGDGGGGGGNGPGQGPGGGGPGG